ncbi:hypothetical protein [Frankia sp. BMG5.23]|uniref:hypothetical protein n=1 Tax=Frankia sp. BMG5.23 TaxID=683305 RepID=UPI000460CDF9|nr:hypothetical protein [Frankia sp. BMG5.23]KDA42948.1 hypothetical protein BMG523Draft_02173 [Frankia sp. BMG5.23]
MPRPERAGRARSHAARAGEADAQLRGLIDAGRSKLPPRTAMRARDAARPTDADLAEAERSVVLHRGSRPAPATPSTSPTDPVRRGGPSSAGAGRAEASSAGAESATTDRRGRGARRTRRRSDRGSAGPHESGPAETGSSKNRSQEADEADPGTDGTSPVRS